MKIKLIFLSILLGVFFSIFIPQQTKANSDQLKILHFSSTSCKPCIGQAELVQKVAEKRGISISLLQYQNNLDLAKKYNVQGTPSVVLLKNGQFVAILPGLIDEKLLNQFLNKNEFKSVSVDDQTDDIQSNDISQQNIDKTQGNNKTNIPLVAGIATATIAAVGTTIIIQKKLLKTTNTSGLVSSPADGSMVSPKQAQYEQSLLNQGFVYNPAKDGFDYVPKKVVPDTTSDSLLSKQVKKMRADNKNKKRFLDDAIKKVHQQRVDNIHEDIEFEQKQYKRHIKRAQLMDTLSKGAQMVEKAADVGVDALSEATGPVGKSIKTTYETAKDDVAIADRTVAKGKDGFFSATKDVLLNKARGKVLDKLNIPKSKAGNKALRYMEDKAVNDYIDSELEEKIQKPLEDKVSELIGKK